MIHPYTLEFADMLEKARTLIKETFDLDLTQIERAELKEVALEVLAERDKAQNGKKIPEELNWRLIVQPCSETVSRFMIYFYATEPDASLIHYETFPLARWITDWSGTYNQTEIPHPIATPDFQRYLQRKQAQHHHEE
jgi:hypothetical protein